MSNWAGVWMGLWEGSWEGESDPGVLSAALVVVGTSTSTFGAELTEAPAQVAVIVGGGSRPRRRGPMRYSEVRRFESPGTVVSAVLVITAASDATFAPILDTSVNASMASAGRAKSSFGAHVAVRAALADSTQAGASFGVAMTQAAALQSAGASAASFGATSNTRVVVAPIRPRVELADDELAAVLLLLAA